MRVIYSICNLQSFNPEAARALGQVRKNKEEYTFKLKDLSRLPRSSEVIQFQSTPRSLVTAYIYIYRHTHIFCKVNNAVNKLPALIKCLKLKTY